MVDGAAFEMKKINLRFQRESINFMLSTRYLQALDLDLIRANVHLVKLIAAKPVYLAYLAVFACKCLVTESPGAHHPLWKATLRNSIGLIENVRVKL